MSRPPITPRPRRARRCPRAQGGFTLIELMLALTLVAALLAIAFGALRTGLASWRQGEDRAEVQQHARSLVQVLARAVAGATAYVAAPREGAAPVLLFQGEAGRLTFVSATPPLPPAAPVAFMAVTLSMEPGEAPGLAIRQKALPNADPLAGPAPVLVDAAVEKVGFRYLRGEGAWEEAWDGEKEKALPVTVEITVTSSVHGRTSSQVLTVPIPVAVQ